MAITKVNFRSISLPSRLPSTSSNLQSCKNVTSLHTTSEEIQYGLLKLAQVYNSAQQLSASQKSLSSLQHHLDESVELIDTCNVIKEMFQMIKENVQSLQSAIRRKGLGSVQEDISSYLYFRKKMNKNLSKCLKKIKNMDKKSDATMVSVNVDQDKFIGVLRDATEYSVAIFSGILNYLSCHSTKFGGWNLISRLVITKSQSSSNVEINEVESVDLALAAKTLDCKMVNGSLQNLDSCIEGFEEGLEILFREMIRCRVSVLNILNDH